MPSTEAARELARAEGRFPRSGRRDSNRGMSLRTTPVLAGVVALWFAWASACASSGGEAKKASTSSATSSASASANAAEPTTPAAKAPQPAAPAVVLMAPGQEPARVTVEIARTEPERRVGLMHRKHLGAEAGMLFLFERSQQLTFWMRNTFVPLDMIFITEALTVLGVVENAEPLTESPRAVPGISKYVLEVNAGYSRAHGVGPGTVVRFEGVEL